MELIVIWIDILDKMAQEYLSEEVMFICITGIYWAPAVRQALL